MSRVNYVIACWLKNETRLNKHPNAIKDPYLYIKNQVKFLNFLEHNLDTVTFVINRDIDGLYKNAKDFIPDKIKNTKIVSWNRENRGMSYGAYNSAYERFRDKFDYYIFAEDDYVYVQHNFDSIMINMLEEIPNCGYLCSNVGHKNIPTAKHGASSNGLASTKALEKIFLKYGNLPHDNLPEFGARGQVMFTQAFMDLGFELCDFGNKFGVIHQMGSDIYEFFNREDSNKPILNIPQKYLETPDSEFEKAKGTFIAPC